MAVLLFRAKPVSGSTSRKWDTTCLTLLPRMYRLASLSHRKLNHSTCPPTPTQGTLTQEKLGKTGHTAPMKPKPDLMLDLYVMVECMKVAMLTQ